MSNRGLPGTGDHQYSQADMGFYFAVLIVCGGLFVWAVTLFNNLVQLRQQVNNAWSQIDVQLKRRHDLIPELVSAVKAHMNHERTVLELVTRTRADAVQIAARGNAAETSASEKVLNRAIGGFLMMIEQYPDLKATKAVRQLLEDLESTENRIAFARQQYNDCVCEYNSFRQRFPNSLVAGTFRFHNSPLFEINGLDAAAGPGRQDPDYAKG